MASTITDSRLAPRLTDIDRAFESLAAETGEGISVTPPGVNRETEPSGERLVARQSLPATNRSVLDHQKNAKRPRENRSLGFALAAEHRSRLCWFIGTSAAGAHDPDSLTYERYCGLREKPFSLSSDPRFFFNGSSHGVAFDALVAGIRRREGILSLTGEVGTGKTTLCRAVLHSLNQKAFAAFVPDPFLSREDLLKTLLVEFGIVSADAIRSGRLRGATRTDLSYPLYDFLLSLQALNALVVVMIDEAQNLTSELLEEIRILSDLENEQKLLEVFLVGQPELQSRLTRPEMRQLNQRVAVRHELSPLTLEEVPNYISHRLTVAGNDGRVQFVDDAIDLVFASSQGIPRVINLVCDRALWRAADSRTTTVGADHVRWAIGDNKLPVVQARRALVRTEPEAVPADAIGHEAAVPTEAAGSSANVASIAELSVMALPLAEVCGPGVKRLGRFEPQTPFNNSGPLSIA
jgi:general secretion pathway protein A